MNRKSLFAAVAFAVIGSAAFAQEATPDTWMQVPTVKSFDQVRTELYQARADGSIKRLSLGYLDKIDSVRSRDEVRAEAIAALRSGEMHEINSEAYAFSAPAGPLTMLARLR
jgi:hypothetical protein